HYEIWLIFFLKYFIYFFFSSRRRHTISKRDWSSDVCSSDLTHRYSAGWAYPTAAAGGVLGIAVLSMFFARWFRQRVRLRGRLAPTFCVLYVIAGVLGVYRAQSDAGTFEGTVGWYLAPMWFFLILSVASLVYQFRSPHNPAWDHIIDKRKWRFDVQRLHPADRAWMMQERDCAVRILIERGLYEGASAEELAKRPLGELHLPTT